MRLEGVRFVAGVACLVLGVISLALLIVGSANPVAALTRDAWTALDTVKALMALGGPLVFPFLGLWLLGLTQMRMHR